MSSWLRSVGRSASQAVHGAQSCLPAAPRLGTPSERSIGAFASLNHCKWQRTNLQRHWRHRYGSVLLVTAALASLVWTKVLRREWDDVRSATAATTAGSWRGPPRPASAPVGLSRGSRQWTKWHEEGLFAGTSRFYPRPYPPDDADQEEYHFWRRRVAAEYPEGCSYHPSGVKRCLPSIVIAGQVKCATTSMFDTLARHPDVLVQQAAKPLADKMFPTCAEAGGAETLCRVKEVQGFMIPTADLRWSEKTLLDRYHYSLPNQSWADRRPVIEASPNYFSMMVDAFDDLERFTLYDPDIKCGVIVMTRNPIDRAVSDFLMLSEPPFLPGERGCAEGHNFSFAELAAEELEFGSTGHVTRSAAHKSRCLRESSKWWSHAYYGREDSRGRLLRWGDYAHYAEPWMRLLGPDRLLFVKAEDFSSRGDEVVSGVLRWLGLRDDVRLPVLKSNSASCRGMHRTGTEAGGKGHKGEVSCRQSLDARRKHVPPELEEKLRDHFRDSNRRFGELTGIDTADWV